MTDRHEHEMDYAGAEGEATQGALLEELERLRNRVTELEVEKRTQLDAQEMEEEAIHKELADLGYSGGECGGEGFGLWLGVGLQAPTEEDRNLIAGVTEEYGLVVVCDRSKPWFHRACSWRAMSLFLQLVELDVRAYGTAYPNELPTENPEGRLALDELRPRIRELEKRVAELEAHELAVAQAVGMSLDPDGGCPEAGPEDLVLDAIRKAVADAGRVAELEAPPVVPCPCEVLQDDAGDWQLVEYQGTEEDDATLLLSQCGDSIRTECRAHEHDIPALANAGLLYAIRTGKRPPHEGER